MVNLVRLKFARFFLSGVSHFSDCVAFFQLLPSHSFLPPPPPGFFGLHVLPHSTRGACPLLGHVRPHVSTVTAEQGPVPLPSNSCILSAPENRPCFFKWR